MEESELREICSRRSLVAIATSRRTWVDGMTRRMTITELLKEIIADKDEPEQAREEAREALKAFERLEER
jgi:hypothetical protein